MRFLVPVLTLLTATALAQEIPAVPQPMREFRSAWVATVRCIDWPSKPGLPSAEQKAELLAILDKAAALRLNALMLQVRPAGDALYRSELEPWSPWLTGQMGKAPSPLWDPLEFAIAEGHRRGLQIHAWFNPFRALSAADRFQPSAGHITRQHKEWTARYAGDVWMNPGVPAIRQRAIDVMTDVARRYDVDGIHMDDYFYPYPDRRDDGSTVPFPDTAQYSAYLGSGGKLELRAWRRQNMDGFIRDLYAAIKRTKPAAAFSISPFGYWRPTIPAGIHGELDPYDSLAADVRLWLHQGWVDFLVPQLYWPIDPPKLSFLTLYDWWQQENPLRKPIYAGLAIDRVGKDRGAQEVINQIQITRRGQAPAGQVHWNFGSLVANKDEVATRLAKEMYPEIALPPSLAASPALNIPTLTARLDGQTLRWDAPASPQDSDVRWCLVQVWNGKIWTTHRLQPSSSRELPLPAGVKAAAVRAVTALGQTGLPSVVKISVSP